MIFKKIFHFLLLILAVFGQNAIEANPSIASVTNDLPHAIDNPNKNKEIAAIDLLINCTQQSLENQKTIKTLIIDYQNLQAEYLMHENDADLLMRTARAGKQLLDKINENTLTHNFDPEFISELTLFSNVASKRGIPK